MLRHGLSCTPHVLEGLYLTVAYSLTGNLLQWFRERLGEGLEREAERRGMNFFDLLVEEAFQSIHPVLVLPHFSGSGTPNLDPDSMGALVGMSFATEPRDIAMGLIEGIGFEMALNLEAIQAVGLPVHKILAGGRSKKPEITRTSRRDFGRISRRCKTPSRAAPPAPCSPLARWIPRAIRSSWPASGPERDQPVQPHPDEVRRMAQRRAIYKELYPALADIHHKLRKQ